MAWAPAGSAEHVAEVNRRMSGYPPLRAEIVGANWTSSMSSLGKSKSQSGYPPHRMELVGDTQTYSMSPKAKSNFKSGYPPHRM
eukprot:5779594-Karenia_brevis.AAC.1